MEFLPGRAYEDSEARTRFKREAEAAARVNHPNICVVHALEHAEDRDFIVMEYVEGRTLRDLIRHGDLGIDRIIDIAKQIADGLGANHQKGIVHRDVKPENVLVTSQGGVKITDFGVCTWLGAMKLTPDESVAGTADYCSPEQVEGKPVDRRSDLFSLGVVLYEMITGQQPFHREKAVLTLHAIAYDKLPELTRRPDVPLHLQRELQRIVEKCLKKNAADRYASADALMPDLRDLQRSLSSSRAVAPPKSRIRVLSILTKLAKRFFSS
jgi:serine/threonine-protein kinase